MSKQLRPCPDCGARIGERHRAGCDIERCYHCGWQALGCLHFDPSDARREVWTGKWPGEEDCARLDFFVNGDADFPDLNRLFTDCVWERTPDVGSGDSKRARPTVKRGGNPHPHFPQNGQEHALSPERGTGDALANQISME
jgi:hypothetical protein